MVPLAFLSGEYLAESSFTELDAVNQMLLTIGEQKVNSLESSGVLEVDVAKATLAEVSRTVQGEGWFFNTEHRVKLPVDSDGHIQLPNNCLHTRQRPRSRPQLVQRGTRLYNLTDHSYAFRGPVTITIVYLLPFDELVTSARQYIARRASRLFQERVTGSQVTDEFVMREEALARAALEADNAEAAGFNILTDNQPTLGTVARDRDWY